MSKRYIRLAQLASFPARSARSARPAMPARHGKLPMSPATIWRWVREGKFPKPIKLSSGVTVWDIEEVDAFIANRAKGDAQ